MGEGSSCLQLSHNEFLSYKKILVNSHFLKKLGSRYIAMSINTI